MSFKRDGDDSCQLNVLQKRRVEDLLASYIPEDEALLCKNGQYACTVCPHRPVVNTIDMLTVHRNGKKHLTSLQRFYGKKTEHNNEIQKRRHQEYIRAEETGKQPTVGPAPLLSKTRRITQHALLKAAPYNSCCSRNRSGPSNEKGSSAPDLSTPPGLHQTRDLRHSPGQELSTPHTTPEPSLPSHTASTSDVLKRKSLKQKKSCVRMKGTQSSGQLDSGTDLEKGRELQHYLMLKSSGWIPDGSGKWVKDENVEFDSDEEEPPELPPS